MADAAEMKNIDQETINIPDTPEPQVARPGEPLVIKETKEKQLRWSCEDETVECKNCHLQKLKPMPKAIIGGVLGDCCPGCVIQFGKTCCYCGKLSIAREMHLQKHGGGYACVNHNWAPKGN